MAVVRLILRLSSSE